MRLCGRYLERAVRDPSDAEARHQMMWAATLAGIAFGNAGVHAPHAMAYAVAGRVRDFRATGYPDAPLGPHAMAVPRPAPPSPPAGRRGGGATARPARCWGATCPPRPSARQATSWPTP